MRLFDRLVRRFTKKRGELYLDEIFLDAKNLPAFDVHQVEGRIVHPISKQAILALVFVFVFVALLFIGRLWILQVSQGETYRIQSEQNRLHKELVFADRGIIYDRTGVELAWNAPHETEPFAERMYQENNGFAHLVGYLSYPQKDTAGIFYQEQYVGVEGAESTFNDIIQGRNGLRLIETDARGEVHSESTTRPPKQGESLTLSIDARVQTKFYELISDLAEEVDFVGGAGAIMDIQTGELLALTSYPEYSSSVLSRGEPSELIASYIFDEKKPFLNRVVSGLYTPGSIIKPFIAAGALEEEVIDPEKEILSTGSIKVPNPYLPGQYSVFNDWKAHGLVDMRHALAVSSNVYFYYIGGGFEDQAGLGIANIDKYMRAFGFGKSTGISLLSEGIGVIPTPEWKATTFNGEPWRIGDTYNTTIGQYGFQVTPLQVMRGIAAIANGGALVSPTLISGERGKSELVDIARSNLAVVREGMRLAVLEGTAIGLNTPHVAVAAKTGTAERGVSKDYVNSWVTGFFPYERPRYAFVVTMEKGPRGNLLGGVSVMRSLLDWMAVNTAEYLE